MQPAAPAPNPASGSAVWPRPGVGALSLMQDIYELDGTLHRLQRCGLGEELYVAWSSHASLLQRAQAAPASAWALDILRIVALRHGLDPVRLHLGEHVHEEAPAVATPRA